MEMPEDSKICRKAAVWERMVKKRVTGRAGESEQGLHSHPAS